MEENQLPASPEPSRHLHLAQVQVRAGNEAQNYHVPWSILDTWLGVGLLAVLFVVLVFALLIGLIDERLIQSAGILLIELIFLLPVFLILAWRKIHWKLLGFGKFPLKTIGIGIVLLLAGYMIIIPHNYLLYELGVDTQGDQIFKIFNNLESPAWFIVAGALIAPVVEEIFFRGFLFQGFRQKYGWAVAILLSSFIFAAAHLDPVAFIPTLVLGCVLAFMYHISNSVWPGIIFHFGINSFGLCALYLTSQYPGLIPS